jgi:hypothetical protein
VAGSAHLTDKSPGQADARRLNATVPLMDRLGHAPYVAQGRCGRHRHGHDGPPSAQAAARHPPQLAREGLNEVDNGGHVAAGEEPEVFSTKVRAAFSSLR